MFHLQNGSPNSCENNLNFVDVFIEDKSAESLKKGALEVIKSVRKCWPLEDVEFKMFTDGITNRLLGCYLKTNKDDMILIRVYGQNTELFIDRTAEVKNMLIMYYNNLAAPLYCAFKNGLCYGYNPGDVLNTDIVRDPHISKLIAQSMARMHSIQHPQDGLLPVPSLFPTMRKYLGLIPTEFPDPEKNLRFQALVPSKSELEKEVEALEQHLSGLGSPVVFCHNDLLLKNVIYNSKEDKVIFIDYEYADYNYQALDIGNHFCEFGGVEDFDASLYPEKELQMTWLRHYLEEWYKLIGRDTGVTDYDVQVLYTQVNKFALASSMFWGLWALIQSAHSNLQFDFLRYASQRLDMYFSQKKQFFSLKLPEP